MIVAETPRLTLRHLDRADAPFIHALYNDPEFLAQIGDRGIHDLAAAETWAGETMPALYADTGLGMYALVERESGVAVGVAGLIDREGLDAVDLGFALLPDARGKGYATEAGQAVLTWAAERGIAPIVAIVAFSNVRSPYVLDRLGFVAHERVRLPGDDAEVMLYRRPGESEGDDMLLAMLLAAQSGGQAVPVAPAPVAAPCATTDGTLPANLAGWIAPRSVGDLRPGTALTLQLKDRAVAKLGDIPPPKAPGRIGITRFSTNFAGTFSIALDQRGWIDVYSAKGRQPLISVGNGHGPECSMIAKIVRFSLPRGSYRVVISGIHRPTARVMLVEGA